MRLRHITSSSLFFFYLNLNTQKIICGMFRVSELATEFIVPGCKTKTNFVKLGLNFFKFVIVNAHPSPAFLFP